MAKSNRKKTPKDNRCDASNMLAGPLITRSKAALLSLFKGYATNPRQLRDPALREAVKEEILRTNVRVITRRQGRIHRGKADLEELAKKLKFTDPPASLASNSAVLRRPQSPTPRRLGKRSRSSQSRSNSVKIRSNIVKNRHHILKNSYSGNQSQKVRQNRNQSVKTVRGNICGLKREKKNLILIRGKEPRNNNDMSYLSEGRNTTFSGKNFDKRLQAQMDDKGITSNDVASDHEETMSDFDKPKSQAFLKWDDNDLNFSGNQINVTNWIDNAVASVSSIFTKMIF